jgi:hypothetical protein
MTSPSRPLICLWQHDQSVDIAPMVRALGINTVWTDDEPCRGQAWEETHMWRALRVPGVAHVIAKIERIQWGQTHEGSLKHAAWTADLALRHPEIVGLYLNDFYDEIEDGFRTLEQWHEIIAAARAANPRLPIWVPHYPHRGNQDRAYDFDHDAIIFNLWHHLDLPRAEEHLLRAEEKHCGKPLVAGLYLSSGSEPGRWLTEEEFKRLLDLFVADVKAGRAAGLRIFCACQLAQRPEYLQWAEQALRPLGAGGA